MEKNPSLFLHEVLFGTSDKAESKKIKKLEEKGLVRKIAPRIYTSNMKEEPEAIILRNWFQILSHLYPDALLSHRSALEFKPTSGGHIFLTYTYTKKIRLPGLTIHFIKGHEGTEGDAVFWGNLHASQEARAFLENLQQTKKSETISKSLSQKEIEEKLELILRVRSEEGLNQLRDKAREVAEKTGMQKEFDKLNTIIGALLSTRSSRVLVSDVAKARVLGEPIDANRVRLFEGLYNTLTDKLFPDYQDKNVTDRSYRNFAFFESYFSNYIEGTVFGIDEAKQIITTQTPMPARAEDSHDVLGTYQVVSDRNEMAVCPQDADNFIQILQYRHSIILKARPSKNPGQFKDKNNYAGSTSFVDFQHVKGTLKRGFDYYVALRHPFAKAIYMMFMISEVHPFLDGNGRIARIMMNAELSAQGRSKIIIPTVYRDDYMLALRRLTRQEDPEAYIRMMQRANEFSKNVYDEDLDKMEAYLRSCDAFLEHNEGKLKIIERT